VARDAYGVYCAISTALGIRPEAGPEEATDLLTFLNEYGDDTPRLPARVWDTTTRTWREAAVMGSCAVSRRVLSEALGRPQQWVQVLVPGDPGWVTEMRGHNVQAAAEAPAVTALLRDAARFRGAVARERRKGTSILALAGDPAMQAAWHRFRRTVTRHRAAFEGGDQTLGIPVKPIPLSAWLTPGRGLG
jgi:hypothetical protein